jgi:hypothetical protein
VFAWSPKVGWGSKGRSKVGRVLSTVNLRRKLVVIAWHMLSKGEDYVFARPPLVREKIRRLELLTGTGRRRGERGSVPIYASRKQRSRARLARQAERAYARLVRDWQPAMNKSAGAAPSSEAKNDSPTQEMNAWLIRQAAPPPSVTATL